MVQYDGEKDVRGPRDFSGKTSSPLDGVKDGDDDDGDEEDDGPLLEDRSPGHESLGTSFPGLDFHGHSPQHPQSGRVVGKFTHYFFYLERARKRFITGDEQMPTGSTLSLDPVNRLVRPRLPSSRGRVRLGNVIIMRGMYMFRWGVM